MCVHAFDVSILRSCSLYFGCLCIIHGGVLLLPHFHSLCSVVCGRRVALCVRVMRAHAVLGLYINFF